MDGRGQGQALEVRELLSIRRGTLARLFQVAREEAAVLFALACKHWWGLALLFAGLWLPLWGFSEIADEVHESDIIPFDDPILLWSQSIASPGLDRFFVVMSELGFLWFLVPANIVLVAGLAWAGRTRHSVFAAVALGGSALLNLAAKLVFSRERPALWESIIEETSWSFPSGHAMGAMTFAVVITLLARGTRLLVPVAVLGFGFAALVGYSRVYLGVHYPSDILAGWAAASVWAVGCYGFAFGLRRARGVFAEYREQSSIFTTTFRETDEDRPD